MRYTKQRALALRAEWGVACRAMDLPPVALGVHNCTAGFIGERLPPLIEDRVSSRPTAVLQALLAENRIPPL